jgi:hypothetical protein
MESEGNWTPAIVAASDRKLTDAGLGMGYESSKIKGTSLVDKHHLVLVAGDISAVSQVLGDLHATIGTGPTSTRFAADRLGELMSAYRTQEAAKTYLAPLGLTSDTFIARQREMEPGLVARLSKQLQDHTVDAEFLVSGVDDANAVLYHVNNIGIVTNHTDTGFLSIGTGGIHSSAYFMTLPYTHMTSYYYAMYQVYAAKRRSEVDPYVGKNTDLFVITRHGGISQIPPDIMETLGSIYEQELEAQRGILPIAEQKLMALHATIWPASSPEPQISDATSSSDHT